MLAQLKPLSEHSPFVFPGRVKHSQPMHSETVNKALWRMGYGGELVSHGFRALGSIALNEAGFPPDVIETALAHVDANPTRLAYNRATYMAQRVELMDWWGQKISGAFMVQRGYATACRSIDGVYPFQDVCLRESNQHSAS